MTSLGAPPVSPKQVTMTRAYCGCEVVIVRFKNSYKYRRVCMTISWKRSYGSVVNNMSCIIRGKLHPCQCVIRLLVVRQPLVSPLPSTLAALSRFPVLSLPLILRTKDEKDIGGGGGGALNTATPHKKSTNTASPQKS